MDLTSTDADQHVDAFLSPVAGGEILGVQIDVG